jgi:flagellar L-ring protein FlgH
MTRRSMAVFIFCLLGLAGRPVLAQSSSLYLPDDSETETAKTRDAAGSHQLSPNGPIDHLSTSIAKVSLVSCKIPPPRKYALHDLVTIVVRESTEAAAQSDLNTNKQDQLTSLVQLPGLLTGFLNGFSSSSLPQNPQANVQYQNQFQSTGDYDRKDTFTTRITAEIIDVKPNGNVVLEAHKYTKSDKETLDMVLTGTCRKEDIGSDNTVLSTQLADLHLTKNHKGSIHGASTKGVISRALDLIFNF